MSRWITETRCSGRTDFCFGPNLRLAKTGAFLQLLRNLIASVAKNQVATYEIDFDGKSVWFEPNDFFPNWFFPEEDSIFGEKLRKYNELLTGKYHGKVATLRLEAWEKSKQNVGEYQKKIFELEGPLSKDGRDRLMALKSTLMEDVANWDGFLNRDKRIGKIWKNFEALKAESTRLKIPLKKIVSVVNTAENALFSNTVGPDVDRCDKA